MILFGIHESLWCSTKDGLGKSRAYSSGLESFLRAYINGTLVWVMFVGRARSEPVRCVTVG